MRRFRNYISNIRLRLLSKANVLCHSTFHELSLQPFRLAEHDGSSHAPQKRGNQRCFVFQLSVNPRARIFGYTDSYGNLVHHFDLPSRHGQLTIISDALVNIDAQPRFPRSWTTEGWNELEQIVEKKDYWDMLMPSHFARPSPELEELAKEIGATERDGRSPLGISPGYCRRCASQF